MSFLVGRDGNISVIRAGALVAILGIIFIVGGLVIFSFEQASYQSPLFIEPIPGATEWGQPQNTARNQRTVLYQIPGKTPQEVRDYYQQKLDEYYGNTSGSSQGERCVRLPSADENAVFSDYREGSGNLPYYYRCIFNRSGFRLLQVTEVQIEPGVLHLSETGEVLTDTRGMTIVQYKQQWER